MIDELIKLANNLDEKGLHSEANHLDKIIVMASTSQSILSKLKDIENGIVQSMNAARKLIRYNIDYEVPPFIIFNKPEEDRNTPDTYGYDVYTYAYHLYYLNEDIKKLSGLEHGFSFINNDLRELENKLRQFFNAANTLRLNRLKELVEDGERKGRYHIGKEVLRLNQIIRKTIYHSEQEMTQFSEYGEFPDYKEELPA